MTPAVTHQRNRRSLRLLAPTALWQAAYGALGLLIAGALSGCAGGPAPVPTIWPPPDFQLVVEEFEPGVRGLVPTQRFSVRSDGICVFARSTSQVADSRLRLPVYAKICAYELLAIRREAIIAKGGKGAKKAKKEA